MADSAFVVAMIVVTPSNQVVCIVAGGVASTTVTALSASSFASKMRMIWSSTLPHQCRTTTSRALSNCLFVNVRTFSSSPLLSTVSHVSATVALKDTVGL